MPYITVLHITLCLLVLNSLCYRTLAGHFKECAWNQVDSREEGVIKVSYFPVFAF